jgi:predicted RNA methylase
MSQAAPYLRRAKSEFESQGITGDVQIAGHVAFLLLIRDQWEEIRGASSSYDPYHLSRTLEDKSRSLEYQFRTTSLGRFSLPKPPGRQVNVRNIIYLLEQALAESPHQNLGDFFQHEVRFEFLKAVRRESYPTPHHLADFIARLGLRNVEQPEIFDPAAGSAGLLVAALHYAPNARLTGCDFDPNIAELGVANLLLHGKTDAVFHQESALRLSELHSEGYIRKFDSVIMNPPFGGTLSSGDAEHLRSISRDSGYNNDYGRSIHTLFGALALQVLKSGGQAAFLLPTGSLFGSRGDDRFRRDLLEFHQLEAIITLSKDLFQPYSNVAAHLVVVRKGGRDVPTTSAVWFGTVGRDGYSVGAGRDLTLEAVTDQNELPRMRDLVLRGRDPVWNANLTVNERLRIEADLLQSTDGLPGVAVRVQGSEQAVDWKILALPSGVLVQASTLPTSEPDGQNAASAIQQVGWFYLPYYTTTIRAVPISQRLVIDWTTQITTSEWQNWLANSSVWRWQGENDEVTIQLTPAKGELELKRTGRGSQTYHFRKEGAGLLYACLFDEHGMPLGHWLYLANENERDKLINNEFAGKFAPPALCDAHQQPCGWWLNFPSTQDVKDVEQSAVAMLIIHRHSADLFMTGIDEEYVAWLPDGWLRLLATGQVVVETGTEVRLNNQFHHQGFALGPAPTDVSATHTLFAVYIDRKYLIATDRDGYPTAVSFDPESFLPKPPTPPIAHPSAVIASIRKNQTRLSHQVDSLLNLLGGAKQKPVETSFIPPLLRLLDEQQQRLWQLLQRLSPTTGESHAYFTIAELPRLLAPGDTPSNDQQIDSLREDYLHQQIDLFIKLGLVVRVNVGKRNCYRLANEGDVVPHDIRES